MSLNSNPKIQLVEIDTIEIDPDKRLRPASDAGVESLIASITEMGVMKDPIALRFMRRAGGDRLVLLDGGHRLEAARRLGWETIPARIWADINDDDARLMEIDGNLAGADLNALELSVFLAERKRVYERLHPEVKAGIAGALARWGATEIISFARSVAEKRELSERHIRNFVHIGSVLSKEQITILAALSPPPKLKDLTALAKLNDPTERAEVIAHIGSGTANSVAEALAKLHPKAERPDGKVEAALAQLLTVWGRAPKAAKRQFAAEIEAEFVAILNDRSNPAGV